MKAEELRIGNFIMDSDTERVGHVVRLSEKKVSVKLEHSTLWQDIDDCEPIHLSEEVLLKCPEIQPSIWMKEVWNIRNPKSQFHIAKMKGRFLFRGLGMSVVYVDTLHHLQNLVYTVTGEELEVKWD